MKSREPEPAPPAAPDQASRARKRPRRPFDAVRENLEAIAVAVVLALIIRHFSVEAFEIPTGSMAPTLFGIHSWVECPNCEHEFNIGLKTDTSTGKLELGYEGMVVYQGECPRCKHPHHRAVDRPGEPLACPHCGERWSGRRDDYQRREVLIHDRSHNERGPQVRVTCPLCWYDFQEVILKGNRTGGHKILVNKFAYRLGPPQRWDVIVFQFDRTINYIKRLIGLPGETVLIRGGDVYINGAIERKHVRPEVQEVLYTPIADLDRPERGYQKVPAWKEAFPPGLDPAGCFRWDAQARPPRFSVNTGKEGAGRVAALRYQRPIVNYYHYNLLSPAGHHPPPAQVGDKKVAFSARVPRGGEGWLGAEIRDGEFTFQARIPIGRPDPARPATLRRLPTDRDPARPSPDRPPLPLDAGGFFADSPGVSIPADAVTRVEFENLDDRVAVRLDGREVLWLDYASNGATPRSAEENTLFILAGGGAACDLESIQVYRDIHYTEPDMAAFAVNGKELQLAADGSENQYFPCGDNSPASSDGRYWHSAPEGNLMGKALLVFWPLWPPSKFKFIK